MSDAFLVKVDGVGSVAEAVALQAAGATVIGIDLVPDARYEDETAVSMQVGLDILAALRGARLCVTLDPDAPDARTALAPVARLSPGFVQVPRYGSARVEWREAILASGWRVVLDGEEISYEDEPVWVESRLSDTRRWTGALVQVAVLSDIETPWHFLTTEAPKDARSLLQLEELRDVTVAHDLLVSMEVSAGEVGAFLSALPRAKGVFFRIGALDPEREIGVARAVELVRSAVMAVDAARGGVQRAHEGDRP